MILFAINSFNCGDNLRASNTIPSGNETVTRKKVEDWSIRKQATLKKVEASTSRGSNLSLKDMVNPSRTGSLFFLVAVFSWIIFASMVQASMSTGSHDFKIINAIIKPIAIDMMNNHVGSQDNAKMLFHDKTMFHDQTSLISIRMIGTPNIFISMMGESKSNMEMISNGKTIFFGNPVYVQGMASKNDCDFFSSHILSSHFFNFVPVNVLGTWSAVDSMNLQEIPDSFIGMNAIFISDLATGTKSLIIIPKLISGQVEREFGGTLDIVELHEISYCLSRNSIFESYLFTRPEFSKIGFELFGSQGKFIHEDTIPNIPNKNQDKRERCALNSYENMREWDKEPIDNKEIFGNQANGRSRNYQHDLKQESPVREILLENWVNSVEPLTDSGYPQTIPSQGYLIARCDGHPEREYLQAKGSAQNPSIFPDYDMTLSMQKCIAAYQGDSGFANLNENICPNVPNHKYYRGMLLNLDYLESPSVQMEVDHARSFNFGVDAIDLKQEKIKDWISRYSDDANKNMKIDIEQEVFGAVYASVDSNNTGNSAGAISQNINLGNSVGTGSGPITLTKSNILDTLAQVKQVLREQNIPIENIWIVLPAWGETLFSQSDLKAAMVTGDEKSIIRTGKIGKVYDFDIYISNLLTQDSGTSNFHILFGHISAIWFVTQYTEVEMYKPQQGFGTAMKGLNVYGYGVLQPTAIGQIVANQG